MNRAARMQKRAQYARTNQPIGNLLVNQPAGFPSDYPPMQPIWWLGSDQFPTYGYAEPAGTLSAVSRAVSLIADSLTSLNWRHLSGGPSPRTSSIEQPPPRWLTDPMLLRPDERYSLPYVAASKRLPRSAFWAMWIRSAILYGMGYLIFEESPTGEPIPGTMRILNPTMVTAQYDPQDGFVDRRIGPETYDPALVVETDYDGRFTIGNITYKLLELRNPLAMPDELGVTPGVIQQHARELALANQAVRYASGMYRSGVPSGFLKTSVPGFTEAQAKKLQEQWLAHHGNDQRSIAVLNSTTDFQAIQISPVDAQLIENRYFSLIDISNAFGIPVHLLNGKSGDNQTYSNAESRSLDFKTYGLMPWAVGVEDVLSSLLPQLHWVELDFRTFLRADTKTRYDAYQVGINAGFLSVNEVRTLENLPSLVQGGSEVPAIAPVTAATTPAAPAPAPNPPTPAIGSGQ